MATSLRLLRGSLSLHWAELATLLVNFPKVEVSFIPFSPAYLILFTNLLLDMAHDDQVEKVMEAIFAAVRLDFEFLQKLSGQCIDSNSSHPSEEPILHLFQQCEASLQFLHVMCQQKMVRDRLVKHKVLFKTNLHVLIVSSNFIIE